MKNKKLKNLKQYRNRVRFQFYVVFRPKAQKLFFPIMFLIFSVACTNHWYDNRGVWKFENTTAIETPETVTSHEEKRGETDVVVETAGVERRIQPATPIVELIKSVFHEDAENAVKIAQCESRYNPEQIGDEHLTFTHNGQEYGKSIGLFQVRTGGKERNGKVWVRSNDVQSFEQEMKDPVKNIQKAKEIWSGSKDWSPWYNCAKLNGII